MVFLIKGTLTEEDRNAWRDMAEQREQTTRKKYRKKVRRWLEDKLCAVGNTAFGALTLCAVVSGGMKAGWAVWGLILLFGGPWMFLKTGHCPARETVSPPGQDFPPSGMPDMPVRAEFFGDGCFTCWDAFGKARLGYSSILCAWEDEGRFYLFFRDRPPLVLPKRAFTRWMPEDFRDFLERELGWPVERIK